MERDTHFVLGVFDDEDVLLHAVEEVRASGVKIDEVYSPHPVHGLDEVLGYKRSRLPIAALFIRHVRYYSGFDHAVLYDEL